MKSEKVWKMICLLLVAALFYIGHGLHSVPGSRSENLFESSASAGVRPSRDGVGVATENAETIFTCSDDGKTLYRWQYFSNKNAKYLGKSDAVESSSRKR